jgi:hypothetical protein
MSIIIGRTPECSAIDVRMNVTEIGRLSSSIGQVLINASAESEARFREYVRAGTVLCARSIQPFERGRWRLRRMRVKGPDTNGYGNSIFSLICKLLVLRYLENERV